jgi:hypothetical protein
MICAGVVLMVFAFPPRLKPRLYIGRRGGGRSGAREDPPLCSFSVASLPTLFMFNPFSQLHSLGSLKNVLLRFVRLTGAGPGHPTLCSCHARGIGGALPSHEATTLGCDSKSIVGPPPLEGTIVYDSSDLAARWQNNPIRVLSLLISTGLPASRARGHQGAAFRTN